MRLLALLVLVGSLAAQPDDSNFSSGSRFRRKYPACESILIRGVAYDQIHIDNVVDEDTGKAYKRLKCVNNENNMLKGVQVGRFHADYLSCDEENGWKTARHFVNGTKYYEFHVADATSPLNVSCYKYCAIDNTKGHPVFTLNETGHTPVLDASCPDGREILVGGYKRRPFCSLEDYDFWIRKRVECQDYSHCDPSLVKGVKPEEVEVKIDEHGVRHLVCVRGENSKRLIKMDSEPELLFQSLKCDYADDGWSAHRSHNTMVNFDSKPLNDATISCQELSNMEKEFDRDREIHHNERQPKSTVACEIRGVTYDEVTIDYPTDPDTGNTYKRVKCINSGTKFLKHVTHGEYLKCDEENGWISVTPFLNGSDINIYDLRRDAFLPMDITCNEYCKVNYTEGIATITLNDTGFVSGLNIECPAGLELFIDGYKTGPSCAYGGWSDWWEANNIECRNYGHCDASLINGVKPEEIKFTIDERGERIIVCVRGNDSLRGIEIQSDSKLYQSLKCDQEGWKAYRKIDDKEYKKPIKDLTISCHDYCKSSGEGIEEQSADNYKEIKCVDKTKDLIANRYRVEKKVDNPVAVATCTLRGWHLYYKSYENLQGTDITKPVHFECSNGYGKRFVREFEAEEETIDEPKIGEDSSVTEN